MKSAKTFITSLAAATVISAFAVTAHAEVIAYSTLQITNFRITAGGQQITTPITINNATSSRASFDDAPGVSNSNPTDTAMSCVGDCGTLAQNDFSQVSAGDPTLHFARGDALLTGSLLEPGGANAYSVAETQLTNNVGSNAGGELSTTSTFWTIDIDGALGDIVLEFDALGELLAYSDIPGGFAQADFDWSLTLRDITDNNTGTFVTEFTPNELNQSVAVVGEGTATYSISDSFVLTVSGLLADRRYRLIISHNSDVEASYEAPAPASLAALGLGLLALGGLARRRKAA